MRAKVVITSLALAVLVYGLLFTYVFAISPAIKENSMEEWMKKEVAKKPKFREVCKECHAEVFNKIVAGNHSSVACEDCHGVGYKHIVYRDAASIVIDDSREACMVCHKDVPGRKAIEVVSEEHHQGVRCSVCHDPHE